MKKIESNSLSESFGLTELDSNEIYSVNGGISISTGICKNLGPILPPLSGAIIGPIDLTPIKPIKPIDIIPVPAPIKPKLEIM